MTDKLRELLEDVQTVYEGKGMIVHPNSFDKLRVEVIKLDNINKQQSEQIEKMKSDVIEEIGFAKNFDELHTYNILNNLLNRWEIKEK